MVNKKFVGMINVEPSYEEKEKSKNQPNKELIKAAQETWGEQFKSIYEIKIDQDDGGRIINFFVKGDATEVRNTLPLAWKGLRVVVIETIRSSDVQE